MHQSGQQLGVGGGGGGGGGGCGSFFMMYFMMDMIPEENELNCFMQLIIIL